MQGVNINWRIFPGIPRIHHLQHNAYGRE